MLSTHRRSKLAYAICCLQASNYVAATTAFAPAQLASFQLLPDDHSTTMLPVQHGRILGKRSMAAGALGSTDERFAQRVGTSQHIGAGMSGADRGLQLPDIELAEEEGIIQEMGIGIKPIRQPEFFTDRRIDDRKFHKLKESSLERDFKFLREQLVLCETAAKRRILAINTLFTAGKIMIDTKRQRIKTVNDLKKLQLIHREMPWSEDPLYKLQDKGLALDLTGRKPAQKQYFVEAIRRIGRMIARGKKSRQFDGMSYTKPPGEVDTPGQISETLLPPSETSHSTSTPLNYPRPLELRGDLLDNVMLYVTWEWLLKLNSLLHDAIPIETALQVSTRPNEVPLEPLILQRFVLKTVDLIHQHDLIPSGHLKRFLSMKDTPRFASLHVHEGAEFLHHRRRIYYRFQCSPYTETFVRAVIEVTKEIAPKIEDATQFHHLFEPPPVLQTPSG
ncbi:hypothetical protein Pst134EA_011855 [Puccinia striiformis f. sp. tritici]|uniref:hypothetical protein n=1 Tax=Puccinia striiformis f. sp. tritici TaxID=168172 RepID=UPI002007E7D5|nr:hypothetical protein Pst134EA_011855 [Puccinia striiformis f. sp. tritici]KAH9468227.1 hypothetical protein Pst134EA_011855 [Puccinia striiformis f. sp. tritici]